MLFNSHTLVLFTFTVVMVKVTKYGEQYRVTIPKDVIVQTGWDENTELMITPYLKDPTDRITSDTPMIMRRIRTKKNEER